MTIAITFETRNQYGFPIVDRREIAKQYAAEAKARNQPDCNCQLCVRERLLPAVLNITSKSWSQK